MIGWCMVLLAALLWLPPAAIGTFGLLVIALHNLSAAIPDATVESLRASPLRQILYFGGEIQLGSGGPVMPVLYSLVPWIGVMAAGYAFGSILTREPAERRRLCIAIGCSAIALFLILRGLDVYGDPRHWRGAPEDAPAALFRFLNTTKYPASLLVLLMTLGPAIAVLPLAENARGAIGRALSVFGRVPFFYYLLHIPLIHAVALIVSRLREGRVNAWLFANHPMMAPPPPDGYTVEPGPDMMESA